MPHPQAEPDLSQYDPSLFERPSVTVDIVVFTLRAGILHVLLIQRKETPFVERWALPGGFVRTEETLDEAAARELAEETGVRHVYLQQLRAFGDPGRDPRTRVITIAYTALIPSDTLVLHADTDAADARWFALTARPTPLAFDHDLILAHASAMLTQSLETDSRVARGLLPARFTLTQMQGIYEALLARPFDKRNFRKWALANGRIQPTNEEARGRHRPAQLFEFVSDDADSVFTPFAAERIA